MFEYTTKDKRLRQHVTLAIIYEVADYNVVIKFILKQEKMFTPYKHIPNQNIRTWVYHHKLVKTHAKSNGIKR